MLDLVQTWPDWLQSVWFFYVTFHDLVQWGVVALVGLTAWGQRKKKEEADKLLEHIHNELHKHIEEDASFHQDLGQTGMTKGL